MLKIDVAATVRTVFGKGAARRLRMDEQTPAVLYAGGSDALSLQVDALALHRNLFAIHGRNAVVSLNIDGDVKGTRHVLVKEIQKNPVTEQLIHVDFLEIPLDQPREFTVPIQYLGKARGVDKGGLLQVFRSSVQLRGCPLDIPDTLEVDITELDQGQAGLTCDDLNIPGNVELLDKRETVCVAVA
ncbi:MAG: 50S ribosomal protein L25 [Deltaproteobacteria bacterium]|nr:50S ribosomal protein L25 [Deltaproteobacteria bacterium]